MADIYPVTSFTVTLTEKEYHLVMLALAVVATAAVKPEGHHRREAAALNVQLLQREQQLLAERGLATAAKLDKAAAIVAALKEPVKEPV